MKRLNLAFGLFLACGAYADFQGQCSGEAQTQASEVVVWVNEQGVPISTETNYITPTAVPQGNPAVVPQVSVPKPDVEVTVDAPAPAATEDEPSHDIAAEKPVLEELRMSKPPGHPARPAHAPAPPAPALPALPALPLGLPELPKPNPQLPNLPLPKLPFPPLPELPLQPHSPHPAPHPPAPHADSHRRFGISYSPYKVDRTCKSQAEVNKDLDQLSSYKFIRIYGTDCDQTKLVANAARIHNMKVFAGVYDLSDFPASLESFNQAATKPDGQKDWSVFHTIAVGNELVNGGMATPEEVIHAVGQARTILRGQGYQGPVVTVDTFSVLLKHPELCKVSDYCAANCHAFFDATVEAHNAGPYALGQANSVSQAAGGKYTMITESGWPHAGQSNGAAVPSPENQRAAVESLRKSFANRSDDLVLFTAFDDLWKDDNQWTFNAERFWGIHHE